VEPARGWVISRHPAHAALVSEADFITVQQIEVPRGPTGPAVLGEASVVRIRFAAVACAEDGQGGQVELTSPADVADLIDQLRAAGTILTFPRTAHSSPARS